MAKNFVAKGDVVTVPAPTNVASGDGVLVGTLFGVALDGAAATEDLVLQVVGVFSLPAATADAVTLGAQLYWEPTGKTVTVDADDGDKTDYVLVGKALSVKAGATAGSVDVRLG